VNDPEKSDNAESQRLLPTNPEPTNEQWQNKARAIF